MTINWTFADGFDLYGANGDATAGYWDSVTSLQNMSAGRRLGSQGLNLNGAGSGVGLTKASGSNDAVHHIAVAFYQPSISGSSVLAYMQVNDGTTTQVCINFLSNGNITLTKATFNGTLLATFAGAIGVAATWYGLEFELVIDPTVGSFKLRKNGNTADDFSATGLNTRNTANSYANKVSWQLAAATGQTIDDFVWQSGTATGTWLGDMACYTYRTVSDQSVQWSPSGATLNFTPYSQGATSGGGRPALNASYYTPFYAPCNGTLNSAGCFMSVGVVANVKCTLYADNAGAPGTIIASATTTGVSTTGQTTFPFSSPPSLTAGTRYWIGYSFSASGGNFSFAYSGAYAGQPVFDALAYASFPVSNPTGLSGSAMLPVYSVFNITPSGVANAPFVADNVEDGLNSYNQSSTVSQADFYGIAPVGASVVGTPAFVVTRGLLARNDQGARNASVQNKSGSIVSQAPAISLSTSFQWAWRYDFTDPNTSAAWTLSAVNALQVGPIVTA